MTELDREMDLTNTKLNAVQRRLGELLETDDAGQMCTCMMMCGICVIISLLIIII